MPTSSIDSMSRHLKNSLRLLLDAEKIGLGHDFDEDDGLKLGEKVLKVLSTGVIRIGDFPAGATLRTYRSKPRTLDEVVPWWSIQSECFIGGFLPASLRPSSD